MQRNRNPFDVLHRIRSLSERKRRAELAMAQIEEERAKKRLEERRAVLDAPVAVEDRISKLQLRALQIRGITSTEMLEKAAREFETAEKTAWLASSAWRQSVSDADAAEKLANQRREKIAREVSASSQRMLDDLMMMKRTAP